VLVLEELAGNVIRHGYDAAERHEIEIARDATGS
jgi:anti-sigma regulatory factor (Ser/Thr protein kinase)